MKKHRNKHYNKKEQNKIHRQRLEITKLKEQLDELRKEKRDLVKQLHMKDLTEEKRKKLKEGRTLRRLETSKNKNEVYSNKDCCPKCKGYKTSRLNMNRADGKFYILFCKNSVCNHRTPLLPVDSDDNND